jgi:hypothetical protein
MRGLFWSEGFGRVWVCVWEKKKGGKKKICCLGVFGDW